MRDIKKMERKMGGGDCEGKQGGEGVRGRESMVSKAYQRRPHRPSLATDHWSG